MQRLVSLAVCAVVFLFTLGAMASAQTTTQLQPLGVTSIGASQMGNTPGGAELDPALSTDSDSGNDAVAGVQINRSIAKKHGVPVGVAAGPKPKSNPTLTTSFDALNLYQQRYANGGNQFTVEPPDQGLCAGNGYVLESVNDVLRVFDTLGNPLTGVVDLNTFYGYPAAINRTNGQYGPSITDPSCYFDSQTQRWFQIVLTLDRKGTTSALNGKNHIDIAVSTTSSPLGSWRIYKLPVQNDGTDGTPNHGCAGGPCLGDYPHIGADANGIFITTNEFAVFAGGYYGSQIYALSKAALASGGPVNYVLFNTADYLDANGLPGFTVWPAISAAGQYIADNGGTEHFLSSDAVFYDSGFDNQLRIWTVTNTSSLNSANPQLTLSNGFISVIGYGVPPRSAQKAGDYPLGQFLGDPLSPLDSNDSRMQQVYYANGKLWAALDTGVTFDGVNVLAGAAYFVITPQGPGAGKAKMQGYVAVPNNNVTYPAIAATQDGRGAVAFTLVGPDFYPSAAYAAVDAIAGAGDVQMASAGVGPWDGFTGYKQYSTRPRWGDYGAAVVDGTSIWMASEYVGQTCTLAQWEVDFTCGHTRAQLGNWGTRISQLKMK